MHTHRNVRFARIAMAAIALPLAAQAAVPTDEDIRNILRQRIDVEHQSVGIVVGIIDSHGQRTITYGRSDARDSRPLDGDSVFEIGSVTKVFTSLLLADMVRKSEVSLSDPVGKYLPPQAHVPERNGRAITLVDLATHTSGLPGMPDNFHPRDEGNPYADYTLGQLYQFTSSYHLLRDIGTQYEYSNLGAGLLGNALAGRAGTSYEALVRARVLTPLQMNSTAITLTPQLKTRLVVGHDGNLKPAPNWDVPAIAGAGALRSTAHDLLKFLAAVLGLNKTELAPAMTAMLNVRRKTDTPDLDIALGWHVWRKHGKEIVWHNGGTGGYASFVAYDNGAGVGVVVLSNTQTGGVGVDDIGSHLLDERVPLWVPPPEHKEVKIDVRVYEGYVGVYQLAPKVEVHVTREGERLFVQATGKPKYEIFPEGVTHFFAKEFDGQFTFKVDATGHATEVVLHMQGMDEDMSMPRKP